MSTWGARARVAAQRLGAHRRAVLGGLAVVALAGSSLVIARPWTRGGCGGVSGQVRSLAGAGPEAFGDVDAVSLIDGTVAGAAQVTGARYKLCLAPAQYAIVSRAERLPGGRNVESFTAVTVAKGSLGFDVAALLAWPMLLARPAAASTGGAVAMSRIPLITPDDFHNAPDATVTGVLERAMLDPCAKAGKKIIDEPRVIDLVKQEHTRADSGRFTPLGPLNIPTADIVVSGNVTVGEDGKPVADLTVTDAATGAVIDHIVVAGDPGQFPKTGIGDPYAFLLPVGRGVADRDCKKKEPPTTQAAVTASPAPKSSANPQTPSSAPSATANVLTYSGKVTGSASLGSDGSNIKVEVAWREQATSPANDPSTVSWTLTQLDGTIDVTKSSKPELNCHARLSKKPGAEKVFSPGISRLPGQSDYDLLVESPADGTGTGGPPTFQVQSDSSDTNTYCASPNAALKIVEYIPPEAENAKVAAALHPHFTAHAGRSTPSFNYSNPPNSATTLMIVSDVQFDGA